MATIIQVPTRRRRAQSMFSPSELATFAEAIPLLGDAQAVLVADADTEGEARYAARVAQEELRSTFGLDSRTNVFEHEGRFRAALRRKHGTQRTQTDTHAALPADGQPATPVPAAPVAAPVAVAAAPAPGA